MNWQRRRDLEGGEELGIWLLYDDREVVQELYVGSHECRGGGFDTYTASPDGEWTHKGTFETAKDVFNSALTHIDRSDASLEGS